MKFHEKFIADLSDYYVRLAKKWNPIASKLKLSDYSSSLKPEWAATQKLHSVILEWLNDSHGPRSQEEAWEKLIEVLNSRAVDLTELAKTIEEELQLTQPQAQSGRKEELVGGGVTINCKSNALPFMKSSALRPLPRVKSHLYSATSSGLSSHGRTISASRPLEISSFSDQLTERTKYRFALMVANDNELHATMHFLGSKQRWSKVTEDIKSYTYEDDEKLKEAIELGEKFNNYMPIRVGKTPGVVVKCAAMGSFRPSGSHCTTLQLMKDAEDGDWELKMIFIVGCCGTRPEMMTETKEEEQLVLPPAKRLKRYERKNKRRKPNIVSNPAVPHDKPSEIVPLGTVLVADQIIQYAMGKLNDDKPEWIPKTMWCPPVNLNAVQYGDEGSDACRIVKKVEVATFLSGDFVIKGRDTALELGELHKNQKYVGFEMEGVGAKKATSDAEIFVPDLKMPKVVLVKGVSDKAGGDKNKPCTIQFFPEKPIPNVKEDSRQQMCTISSLTLVLRYIIQFKAKFTNK